jgi:hypothetical protein
MAGMRPTNGGQARGANDGAAASWTAVALYRFWMRRTSESARGPAQSKTWRRLNGSPQDEFVGLMPAILGIRFSSRRLLRTNDGPVHPIWRSFTFAKDRCL